MRILTLHEVVGGSLRYLKAISIGGISVLIGIALVAQQKPVMPEPQTFHLACPGGDCPLLKGDPQTSGMRGGAAKLKPDESVGWHSTGEQEESLVILRGKGVVNIEGRADLPVQENMLAYIPMATKHNVTNTGTEILEYVWVVAPVRRK